MSSQARQLLQLLRLVSNRNCADCDAPLSDSTNVWASTTHGVFICVNCVSIHRKIGVHISRVRSVNHDVWAEEEILNMKSWGGNSIFNSTYERYVPRGIQKPTPDAPFEEREAWIRAKYEMRAFILPLLREEERKLVGKGKKAAKEVRDLTAAKPSSLPMRLVDYFVVVGLDLDACVVLAPKASDFFNFSTPPVPPLSPTGVSIGFSSSISPSSSQAGTGKGGTPTTTAAASRPLFPPEAVKMPCRVVDYYPDQELYADDGPDGCPIPEHVAQFVYPDGYHLSSSDDAPTFFSFVLTNVNGVRSYGCALRIYEELDSMPNAQAVRAALADAFMAAELEVPPWLTKPEPMHHAAGLTISSSPSTVSSVGAASSAPSVFLPKSLVLLSHYPFFSVFREVLLEFYRISISCAPLPIERYIANFVCEVPLPPQGQVEIKFALPDRTLTVSRPPRNRLPMLSFSMRPLFTLLNVDHVLLIFSLLLTETKVALCSAHYALLTPVAEALLALLFPLVWQGAFIPIMPLAMTDILEAPVPFFIGLNRRYLDSTPASHRPAGVVFVDLDNDEVYLGIDEEKQRPRLPPRLPDRETHKLRQKLLEFGGPAFNPKAPEVEGADLAFPNNEHHLPISSFGTEQGMTQKTASSSSVTGSVMSTFGFGNAVSTARSLRGSRSEQIKAGKSLGQHGKHHVAGATLHVSILNAHNNEGMPDRFSANEVRAAFLRFFVSVFRNYQQYVYSPSQQQQPGGGEPPPPGEAFNKEAFIKESSHLSDSSSETLHLMLSSQMFERFIEERIANPNHPQIKFFDESIAAKLNRAKTQLVKKETPFLDDSTDQITEVFNPPPPSNWGLPDTGEGYTYATFPQLRSEMFGNIRKPRRLFKFPEQQRTGSKSVNAQVYQRSLSHFERSTPSTSPQATPRRTRMDVLRDLSRKKVERTLRGIVTVQKLYRGHRCHYRYRALRRATIQLQRQYRLQRSCRADRGRYMERRQQIILIQCAMRRKLARRTLRRRLAAALLIKCWCPMAVVRHKYRRRLRAIVRIQSFFRSRRARRSFLMIRDLVIGAQAVMRGWRRRKLAARERKQRLCDLRRQIFYLWKLAHTPLAYRSRFWMVFDGTGFLHLAIHEDEILKLWKDLGFYREHRPSFVHTLRDVDVILQQSEELRRTTAEANNPSSATDAGRRLSLRGPLEPRSSMRLPTTSPLLSSSRAAKTGSGRASTGHNFDFNISVQFAQVSDVKHLAVAAERLEGERQQLYQCMKAQSTEGTRDSFFHMFGLENQKKRKRHLCAMVWQDLDRADASAQVVLGTIGTDLSKDWVQTKLDQRIRSDLLNTVQACLISIRNQKKSYRRIQSQHLLSPAQLEEKAWQASCLVIKGGHRRNKSSIGSSPFGGAIPSPNPLAAETGLALLQSPSPPPPSAPGPAELSTIWESTTGKKTTTRGPSATPPAPTAGGKEDHNPRRSLVLRWHT